MKRFKFFAQRDQFDCGPTCLKMLTDYFGRNYNIDTLRQLCNITHLGVTMFDISDAAEKIGLKTVGIKARPEILRNSALPCILHWRQNHFVILYKIRKGHFYIADPSVGLVNLGPTEFQTLWLPSQDAKEGNALFVQPGNDFYKTKGETKNKLDWSFILNYLLKFKQLIFQLGLAIAVGTAIQLLIPFLTQSIVDVGIGNNDLSFINLILLAQVLLFLGGTATEFIRSWILLHISTRVNISILTDFLRKLLALPIGFFDSKTSGDIMQRITDEKRIETFLTSSTLSIAFSFVNFIVFSVIIYFYNLPIFCVFTAASIIYILWVIGFMKKRRSIDYKLFAINTRNQDNVVELVRGVQEIKLNNAETRKRWLWEHVQARLFRFTVKNLALNQYQQAGGVFINQAKNIFITYLSAKAVISHEITLGAMLSIQYIIGQLNGPLEQFIAFLKSYQEAKISIERLNEVYRLHDEQPEGAHYISNLPENRDILVRNLTFRYPGAGNQPVLQNISLSIPSGKTTAIVGMSGSGKTTILKLLLRFYIPEEGEIRVGSENVNTIFFKTWRNECGAVLQDGHIFSDTLRNNITVSDDSPDQYRLNLAVQVANIDDILDKLPYGMDSQLGAGGGGLSQGQKQRILIARAVYKDPHYMFFDEATNALDANNEKAIVNNLSKFLKGKTTIVVAHRLSTVKNADNIIVLEKGSICEQGSHAELIKKKGNYYALIKNQLELG